MESKEWITTKIRKPLHDKIEETIANLQQMDVKKYNSITEFVQEACILLLEKEGVNAE